MKEKKKLVKEEDGRVLMSQKNLNICIENHSRYHTP